MGLNKQKGNMYPWVTHTWNVIKGKCPHNCSYCYMKGYSQPELHFDEKELKTDLGKGNFIFVGSSCDMWAEDILLDWIIKTLNHCIWYEDGNSYLFQSKNPIRFNGWNFPKNTILGTTIETNRRYAISQAPIPYSRAYAMAHLMLPSMVSIEPIMDFDLDVMVRWIAEIKPEFVSIGADSKGHKLPEPSPDKVQNLIRELEALTEVKVKDNLKRILRQEMPDEHTEL